MNLIYHASRAVLKRYDNFFEFAAFKTGFNHETYETCVAKFEWVCVLLLK